jgi:DNA topoisomerase-1
MWLVLLVVIHLVSLDEAAKPNLGKSSTAKEKKAAQGKPKQAGKVAKPRPKKLS